MAMKTTRMTRYVVHTWLVSVNRSSQQLEETAKLEYESNTTALLSWSPLYTTTIGRSKCKWHRIHDLPGLLQNHHCHCRLCGWLPSSSVIVIKWLPWPSNDDRSTAPMGWSVLWPTSLVVPVQWRKNRGDARPLDFQALQWVACMVVWILGILQQTDRLPYFRFKYLRGEFANAMLGIREAAHILYWLNEE